ncbi:MAG: glycosyltransferase family 2 protein, partial [Ktedonobacteraceae bacterium]|nr:glycosyltransferase family 2 protein [Ktedonobacteraceae bacterium]
MSEVTSLSVIVPLHNEEENILPLHQCLESCLQMCKRPYEIVYVDDGSTDATFLELQNVVRENPYVRIVQLSRNFGQTAALSAGIAHSSGAILIFMDGDLQNDPQDIPRLLKKLEEGYDVVSGWRRERKDVGFSRKLPSWIANRLISWVTGVHVHDSGCTLKAYRREIFQHVRLYGEMHRFLPAYAVLYGARIAELEVAHHSRRFGSSKYGISRTVRVVLDLLRLKFQACFDTKPMHGFGILGLLWLLPGLVCFLCAFGSRLRSSRRGVKSPSVAGLSGIVCLGFGSMYMFMGLLGELMMRIYYEIQGRKPYVVRKV